MGLLRKQIGDLCFYHAQHCNRYQNGFCSTRKCLRRGGWSPGVEVDYSVATCEEHETIELLERLRDVEDALTRENIATSEAKSEVA